MEIRERTLADGSALIEDIRNVSATAEKFSSSVKWAESGVNDFDMFFLRVYHHQLQILHSALDLAIEGAYVQCFILLRAVFESYFLTELMSKGTRYIDRYPVPGVTEEIRKANIEKLKEDVRNGKYEYVERVANVGLDTRFVDVVRMGLPHEGGAGEMIPFYFFTFQDYDPERAVQVEPLVQGFFSDPATEEKWRKYHASLYGRYLSFDRVLKASKLNGFLDIKQAFRVKVHYSFLSSFVHLTDRAMRRISGNVIRSVVRNLRELQKYNPILSELCQLYILHLTSMHLSHVLNHMKSRGLDVADRQQFEDIVSLVERKYGYFWFIFNQPSEIDKKNFESVNLYKEIQGQPRLTEIGYYSDPEKRLDQIHMARLCPIHSSRT